MSFNVYKEKGTPIEKQIHDWSELNIKPYDKTQVHPYSRCRGILMNGIETEGVIFGHQFARNTNDTELKRQIAMTRRIEQQQQKMVNWMIPAEESVLEGTLGYEQVAVDLTAYLARTEKDPYVKAALDFALLEDFDHLYRYANLMQLTEGKTADPIVKELTEITPGRPTILHHRHPFDSIRKHIDKNTADVLTKVHILTIVSGEQQTMNYYMNVGNRIPGMLGRGLYAEIGMVEEQHVSHYESLDDPTTTWFEHWLMHEYNEAYMYYSCMISEVDPRVKAVWERHLMEEVTHVQMAAEMLKKYENKEPEQVCPGEFPEPTIFQSNKDYVRKILASQYDFTAYQTEYMPLDKVPDKSRFETYQKAVNDSREFVPSQDVIEENIRKNTRDYRIETEGEHPIPRLQERQKVAV